MKKLNLNKISYPVKIKQDMFFDKRGFFQEIFLKIKFNLSIKFTAIAKSKKNVIRGLHFQSSYSQAKLITVTHGKIFDVAVDLRKNSKTFGKYFSIEISQKDDFSFYIPENFAHGFLCLSKKCAVYYKCTNYREKNSEKTILWNDKNLGIRWPIKKPILSKKDKLGIKLSDFI